MKDSFERQAVGQTSQIEDVALLASTPTERGSGDGESPHRTVGLSELLQRVMFD